MVVGNSCWTCRQRKVRCDRKVPKCSQCIRLQLICEGYMVRLLWPDEREGDAADTTKTLHSWIKPQPLPQTSNSEITQSLNWLDIIEPNDEMMIKGHFGVFRLEKRSDQPLNKSLNSLVNEKLAEGPVEEIANNETPKELSKTGSYPRTYETNNADFENSPTVSAEDVVPWNTLLPFLELSEAPEENSVSNDPLSAVFEKEPAPAFLETGKSSHIMWPLRNDGLARLTPEAHFLLVCFHERLMYQLPVVLHSDTFFRTTFTPRALAAVTDIMLTGSTPTARLTVLFATLATASYYVSRREFQPGSAGSKYYRELGTTFSTAAHGYLEQCFSPENSDRCYTDLVVALISLVITEFVDGGQRTDELLALGQRLASIRWSRRTKMSNTDVMIHRSLAINILLVKAAGSARFSNTNDALVQDTHWIDAVFADMSPLIRSPVEHEDALTSISGGESRQGPLNYLQNPFQLDEYLSQYATDVLDDSVANSLEFTWGVPTGLVFLFKEAVLIRCSAMNAVGPEFGAELAQRCKTLEAALESWSRDYEPPAINVPLTECSNAGTQARRLAIINHHSLAFLDALRLFHYRATKAVPPQVLQAMVHRIIEHLEVITYINKQHDPVISNVFFFVGFVGACEVAEADLALRARYDVWLRGMQANCLWTHSQDLAIVDELYSRRARGESCDWWSLARERQIHLCLF